MKNEIFIVIISLLSITTAFSQACIPEWTQPGSGIFPDTITNMPAGPTKVPYDFTVQFKVPLVDSSIITTGINVNRVELTGVSGLENIPSSVPFHYNCNPSNCTFKADSVGCVRIQGTPTTEGIYPLIITAKVFFTPNTFLPVDFSGYEIEISNTIGIPAFQKGKFEISQNSPNPAGSITQVAVNMISNGPMEISISNIIGNEVFRNTMMGKPGVNALLFDVSNYAEGLYFYTVSSTGNTITKRMVVDR